MLRVLKHYNYTILQKYYTKKQDQVAKEALPSISSKLEREAKQSVTAQVGGKGLLYTFLAHTQRDTFANKYNNLYYYLLLLLF